MKRILILAVTTALFALPPAAFPADHFPPSKRIRVGKSMVAMYDKFKDQTTLVAGGQWAKAERGASVWVNASFSCPGDTLSYPERVLLALTYMGREWKFLDPGSRTLMFLLEEERVPITILTHHGDVSSGSASVTEEMAGFVDPELAAKILRSDGEGQLGNTEFVFGKRLGAALAEMATVIDSMKPAARDTADSR